MRLKIIPTLFLVSLALSGVSLFFIAPVQVDAAASLKVESQYKELVHDLQQFIPSSMQAAKVPGLSIALIQAREITWSDGFGQANTLTGKPVNSESVFEVASISKAVAAYAALRLVERGDLSLDEPVHNYLSQPWLPPSDYADQITLRHLLTHTSGLTNQVNPVDKSIVSPPGQGYLYSGVGFIYLQEVMEQVTGRSLEQVAAELVFAPLAMDSSSYVNSSKIYPNLIPGHVDYGIFLPRLLAVLVVAFILILLFVFLIQRLLLGVIALTPRLLIAVYFLAASFTLAVVLYLVDWQFNKWLTLAVLWMFLFGVGMTLFLFVGVKLLPRLSVRWRAPQNRVLLLIIWSFVSLLALLSLTSALSGPVPRSPGGPPNAAYSLRSTAPDLANFLIELVSPRFLESSLAAQMVASQAKTARGGSWGLGIGLQLTSQGLLIWHGGDNSDFHALMLIQPERGDGVVVLTNGQYGGALTNEVAAHALGIDPDFLYNR